MVPIVIKELKDRKWFLTAFILGSLLTLWLYVATFTSSQSSSLQLQELLKTYPKALLEAVGLSDMTMNTLEIYLNAKHFSFLWPLLAIILALSRAGGQIAGEIQNRTMGLLLALPISRIRIFFAKYIAGLSTILIFTTVSVFGVIPLALVYDIPSHPDILFKAWILSILFMWAVYSFSLAISSIVSEASRVYMIGGGLIFLSYIAYILSLIDTKFEWLKNISIFHYYNTQKVLSSGDIDLSSWLLFIGLVVIATLFAAWRFNKRDISV